MRDNNTSIINSINTRDDKEKFKGSYNFEITTTPGCDLNCTYCFEGKKAIDNNVVNGRIPETISKIDEILSSEWFNEEYSILTVDFWGGEPTLNSTIISKIISHYDKNDKVQYHMYTNAYNIKTAQNLLNNISEQAKQKFSIQVSYDGRAINDRFRLTYTGKTSSDQVLETFDWLYKQNLQSLSLKSTLPLDGIKHMSDVWDEFKELAEKYKNINILYSPTIDYHTQNENSDEYFEIFKKEIRKIAKKEIEYVKEHEKFLMSWFCGDDTRITCTSGKNMSILDVDNNIYPCHGVLYMDNKEDFKITSLKDDIKNINIERMKFSKLISLKNEECEKCIATTCLVCPTASYEFSKKDTFDDRWLDRQSHGLCKYFKEFGKIDRAIFHKLKLN